MPRGDKSKYTDKQKRQAEHIEEGYESRGVPEEEAEGRAWATVNKMTGGGKKTGGSGRGKAINKAPAKKGGKLGGAASAARSTAAKSASAKKAAKTRATKGSAKLGAAKSSTKGGVKKTGVRK
ncbi:MAG: plasmid stabilization protein [Acidobacteriota bacterium]|nr:plasmid stabilization protein [Acidobacteriota bacterium]